MEPSKTRKRNRSTGPAYTAQRRAGYAAAGLCLACGQPPLEHSPRCCQKHYLMRVAAQRLGGSGFWSLLADAWEKQAGRCAYSGRFLTLGMDAGVDHKKPVSQFPELAADPQNLQWVHRAVNVMKGSHSETHFLELVARIHEHQTL